MLRRKIKYKARKRDLKLTGYLGDHRQLNEDKIVAKKGIRQWEKQLLHSECFEGRLRRVCQATGTKGCGRDQKRGVELNTKIFFPEEFGKLVLLSRLEIHRAEVSEGNIQKLSFEY